MLFTCCYLYTFGKVLAKTAPPRLTRFVSRDLFAPHHCLCLQTTSSTGSLFHWWDSIMTRLQLTPRWSHFGHWKQLETCFMNGSSHVSYVCTLYSHTHMYQCTHCLKPPLLPTLQTFIPVSHSSCPVLAGSWHSCHLSVTHPQDTACKSEHK